MGEIWKKLYSKTGDLLYEGFTVRNYPSGAGVMYYANGKKYQEGIFGSKGLLSGREYYSNGQIRFDGVLRYNGAYGPNAPIYGKFYDRQGELKYDGKFSLRYGGVGYPTVVIPEGYGSIPQYDRPKMDFYEAAMGKAVNLDEDDTLNNTVVG